MDAWCRRTAKDVSRYFIFCLSTILVGVFTAAIADCATRM